MHNPKILHRIYFPTFPPYGDPFLHYLESWRRELPDYEIMLWSADNLDVNANQYTKTAFRKSAPVFLSEYFRWQVLHQYGGLYLDADCEILNGRILSGLVDDLYNQDQCDTFFGIEERSNGHPTAQTVAAKVGSELVSFMKGLYENSLEPLWGWREKRGLIGPQLMSLYFLNRGINVESDGFFTGLSQPREVAGCRVYPQTYFSPKFTLLGEDIDFNEDKTCIYHMFANANLDLSHLPHLERARTKALTFEEYRNSLKAETVFPCHFGVERLSTRIGRRSVDGIISEETNGILIYGPYVSIPAGYYLAKFDYDLEVSVGRVEVLVTEQNGLYALARRTFDLAESPDIAVPFFVGPGTADKLEVTLRINDVSHLLVRALVVDSVQKQTPEIHAVNPLKVIHRIYFGFDGKPDMFPRYLESWRRELPDFQIIQWDASNLPMDANAYVAKLYSERDHAFLTDYFRWYLLREYGGVYLDADVEVVNGAGFARLVDELTVSNGQYDAVIGIDERGGGWYTAHSMVSQPGSMLARYMCDVYENMLSFSPWRKDNYNFFAPQLTALYFASRMHNIHGLGTSPHINSPIVVAGVKIYPQDYFSPLSPTGNKEEPFKLNALSDNTCLCHHFACSWHDPNSYYRSYSEAAGGQSNALLSEVVLRSTTLHFAYDNPAMGSIVGVRSPLGLRTAGKAGIFVYGPYIPLISGIYRVSFRLDGIEELGQISVDVAAGRGERVLFNQLCSGDDLRFGLLTFVFEVEEDVSDLEVRLMVSESSKFVWLGVIIERLIT